MKSKEESRYLRFLVNLWTIVTFTILLIDAWQPNSLSRVVGPALAIYTGTLALYSAEKEFERWRYFFIGRHPGEVYVVLWTILLTGVFAWDYWSGSGYSIRPDVIATYIVVLGILAITKKSKIYFNRYGRTKAS